VVEPLKLSPLGFGCASVMGKVGKAESLRAMAVAHSLGITHFDVARSYGFGHAERVVGEFLRGRRDKATVTTKFGIVPPNLSLGSRLMIPLVRQISRRLPALRRSLRRKSGELSSEIRFSRAYLNSCLEESLRELGTDYIDIYLLHEPPSLSSTDAHEIVGALQDHVTAGKLRRWGIAYRNPADHVWAHQLNPQIVQMEGNIATMDQVVPILDDSRQRIITRPFLGGSQIHTARIREILRDGEAADTAMLEPNDGSAISISLAKYLAGPFGTVLCSMYSPAHIRENVRLMESVGRDERLGKIVQSLVSRGLHPRLGAVVTQE
jgi:aryl-alcohol dehydrogenase-like predicted oxidoreductase